MLRKLKILEYALAALLRRKYKNASLVLVYAFMVAMLGSVLLLSQSLKQEAIGSLSAAPELVVQRVIAGRHDLIPVQYAETIRSFPGVKAVTPRVWGYYYDTLIKANLTLLGSERNESLTLLEGHLPETSGECAIGQGVARAFGPALGDLLVLEDSDKQRAEYLISGIFKTESNLLTNDLVVLREQSLRKFFGIAEPLATDLLVEVFNPREVQTLAKKIKYHFPDTRPISRDEILHTYDSLFNWRSGMMLAVAAAALVAFCILAWDRATGISAEEKQEIGILKAVGWETADVLTVKFWEGLTISATAFVFGLLAAWVHVFWLGAPFLTPLFKGWSVLFPEFRLTPAVDPYQLSVLAVLTIVPYLLCTVFPAWKAATTDPDDVMRG